MTAPLSAERVEKLSRIVEGMRVAMPAVNSQEVFNDLLAILSSHEKMRAEVKRLKKAIDETGRLDTERIQTVARRKP